MIALPPPESAQEPRGKKSVSDTNFQVVESDADQKAFSYIVRLMF
jgi:hypothetical protein